MNTLNMYNNLQYNPIEIDDYTILEIYKDSIEEYNVVGYHILPIKGLTAETIGEKIAEFAAANAPEGYSSWVALPSRRAPYTYQSYNHRRCYLVYYTGSDIPTYPAEPEIGEMPTPAEAFDPWHGLGLVNEGNAPTPARLSLTLTALDNEEVEFYINGNKYRAWNLTGDDGSVLTVDKLGMTWNGSPIFTFDMERVPSLIPGVNEIKVSKKNVDKVDVFYKARF